MDSLGKSFEKPSTTPTVNTPEPKVSSEIQSIPGDETDKLLPLPTATDWSSHSTSRLYRRASLEKELMAPLPSITLTPGEQRTWSGRDEPFSPTRPVSETQGRGRSGSWHFLERQEESSLAKFYSRQKSRLRRSSTSSAEKASLLKRIPERFRKEYKNLPGTKGLDEVLSHPKQGIPASHLMGLASCLKIRKAILGLRPFERIATTFALSGKRSKDLSYKPKSSNWGPHAALLPFKQCYSKLHGQAESVISKYQSYADALSGEAVALMLNSQRLNELFIHKFNQTSEQTVLENRQSDGNGVIYFTARPEGGEKDYRFRAMPDEGDYYRIEIEEGDRFVTFPVIDLIPDYDMAFLYFPFSETDLGISDKVQISAISHELVQKRLEIYSQKGRRKSLGDTSSYDRLAAGSSSQAIFLKDMDRQYGNLTPKEKAFLPRLNMAIDRSPSKNPMFHHGADNKSPVSELKDNFPMTVIIPNDVGPLVDTYYMLEDKEELKVVLQVLKDHGYYVPINPLWGDVARVRAQSFSSYEELLKNA